MSARKWSVAAAFFEDHDARWIDDFIEDDRIAFQKVLAPQQIESWHSKKAHRTRLVSWLGHLRQARATLKTRPDGIVCAFPQLTVCTALLRKLSIRKPPIIGYNFNLGGFPGGWKQVIARWVAREVAIFVVHSPTEVAPYADYLGVDPARVRFVPLQRGALDLDVKEAEVPYVLAMGSAGRDYETLINAVDKLEIPTRIITRAADIEALPKSPHVSYFSDLSLEACLDMLAASRISVTPVSNLQTASGQTTFLYAMQLGVPVIATDCPGTEGYITDGQNGLLVAPDSVSEMAEAINRVWTDPDLRKALGEGGQSDARTVFSDEAIGRRLHALILEVDPALSADLPPVEGAA